MTIGTLSCYGKRKAVEEQAVEKATSGVGFGLIRFGLLQRANSIGEKGLDCTSL